MTKILFAVIVQTMTLRLQLITAANAQHLVKNFLKNVSVSTAQNRRSEPDSLHWFTLQFCDKDARNKV
jgi:hypothetical protein